MNTMNKRFGVMTAAVLLGLASLAAQSQPQRGDNRGEQRSGERRGGDHPGGDRRGGDNRSGDHRGGDNRRGDPRGSDPRGVGNPGQRWYDGAHGHNHYYPRPGYGVRVLPPRSSFVIWGGVNYGYYDNVWYSPGPRGYVVVRPPYGIVLHDRPALFSVVTIGAIAYLYANGVYYREHDGGGYEVVPPPVPEGAAEAPKTFIYPSLSQSAEKQAGDEYDCHRWAVQQSGFDPSAAAVSAGSNVGPAQRQNYQRAQAACLEGRGYTVR